MAKNRIDGKDIVCIGPVDWEPIWNRSQQLMWRMPKENRVLYLEPPVTLLSAIKDSSLWFKWTLWQKGVRGTGRPNIFLYSPPPVLPFGNLFSWINRFNQSWSRFFVKRILKKLKFSRPVVWTYLPGSLPLAKGLDYSLLVYDCVDEHSEFTGLINKAAVLKMENALLAASDVVFTSAQGLYQSKKDFADRVFLIPNAADIDLFGQAELAETEIPLEVKNLPRPLLGFVGVIHHWIDLDLIAWLAGERPNWTIAMIGPIGPGVSLDEFRDLGNVIFLGHRDKEALPGYLKAFDVCLNTFRINELTQSVNPLKIYEYLAAGRPVVSVDMPGVADFRQEIEIAGDYPAFLKAIEKVLQGENSDLRAHRLQVARTHSWENRLERMLDLL
ncbi:MAG: glycosyltransferase family 1 protein [Peptococcaceae bacterium]|nr:glycosyltransferase family 1 protein [Peptococcaceae bacterium]